MPKETTTSTTTIPAGLCQCGACGKPTQTIKKTDRARGRIKGEPSRYLRGHSTRKSARYVEVDTGWATPCWIWKLTKTHNGYGIEWDPTGKKVRAHRRYYEARNGPIPVDLQLDHLCRIRACVNPDHLEPVTGAENVRRGSNTKLTAKIVIEIRSSVEKQHVLGRRFGITQSQVSRIKNRRSWRDVEPKVRSSYSMAEAVSAASSSGAK
jgi:hypothetical protein